jgi:hypothetical protein
MMKQIEEANPPILSANAYFITDGDYNKSAFHKFIPQFKETLKDKRINLKIDVIGIGDTCTKEVLEKIIYLSSKGRKGKISYLSENADQNDDEVNKAISELCNSAQIPKMITIKHDSLKLEVSIMVSAEDKEYFYFRHQEVFKDFYLHKEKSDFEFEKGLPSKVKVELLRLQ